MNGCAHYYHLLINKYNNNNNNKIKTFSQNHRGLYENAKYLKGVNIDLINEQNSKYNYLWRLRL